MRIDILTLFPKIFYSLFEFSVLGTAIEKELLDIRISNIRNFTYDKHRQVDDTPYGGGAGMLMKPEPIFRAVEAIYHPSDVIPKCILLSPQGTVFNQKIAVRLSKEKHLIFICGHYEGVDERVLLGLKLEEISVGDYILTGGEIPAMAMIDTISRLIPGVLGNTESLVEESFSKDHLEYPQYTKPRNFRGMEVPEVLCSGNHAKIKAWQKLQSMQKTKEQRPDLLNEQENAANL
jgi:tRNA (guanine37-N1)-methyltransferase